jgi:hypothetical protein
MNKVDSLFTEVLEENNIFIPQTLAEKILANSEQNFRGTDAEEENSRKSDEEFIREQIKKLEIQFHKNKNIKNHKLSHLNVKRSELRKVIKRKIAELNLKLQDINMERGEK